MTNLDEIKSRIDIVDLVSESVKLRKSGKSYSGFCPFHANKRTPAFVVWPETGTWRCFGECNDGGDIFKFVMKKEGWDFPEALRHLAAKAGVQLESFTPQQQERREENERLRVLLEEAVNFYRHQLLNTPAGKPALDYLLGPRQLTTSTIEVFGLGYAPAGWDNALQHFTSRSYSEQDLLEAGLVSQRDSGGHYDRFRNRVMIPIRDELGRMAGFGARILDPDDLPKFLNSPQTPVFDKGRLLYGLDRARKPIRAADQVVIVEGYLDVIAVHQAGYENVVSPMGTALTEDHLRMLKRFTRRIVLALDPDVAGQKAVLRGLDAAREALDRESELAFDARGLLRNEARLQADLRVVTLPDELDPDEIVQRDPDEWARLVETARPIVAHVMDTLAEGQDLNDPKVKAGIVAQVLPLIRDLPNPVERDSYRQRLARMLRVDERSLIISAPAAPPVWSGRPRGRGSRGPGTLDTTAPQDSAAAPAVSSSQKIEAQCLGVLLHQPDLLNHLDRALQESGLAALMIEDFGYTDHQIIVNLVRQSLEQDQEETQAFIEQRLPDTLQSLVGDLKARARLDPLPDRNLDEVLRQVVRLRRQAVSGMLNQLRFLLEEAQQEGDTRATEYLTLVLKHKRTLHLLEQAERKVSDYRREQN